MSKCRVCGEKATKIESGPIGWNLCGGCDKISLTGSYMNKLPYDEEWRYIWYDSRKDKSIDWYKQARDKLIQKIDEHNKKEKLKESKRKELLIQTIEGWK